MSLLEDLNWRHAVKVTPAVNPVDLNLGDFSYAA